MLPDLDLDLMHTNHVHERLVSPLEVPLTHAFASGRGEQRVASLLFSLRRFPSSDS
jgi:hypothetical protein